MTFDAPEISHKRKMEVVFDPENEKKFEVVEAVSRKKRVAAYARVSTDQDMQQNSYEAQIEYYSGYIRSKPEWEFAGVYADEGISGTSRKKRDGFNRMVADAQAGRIDMILTKSISRFARNTVDSLTITRELKSRGVEVCFEKENISSMDAQSELIFTIMSSIAQEESRSISENVRWGIQRRMESGRVYIPYSSFLGYEKGEDGFPRIVEEEAAIVRDIYARYLQGESLGRIADRLNGEGIKTPAGKERWTPGTVRRILSNEKYKGDARLQKTYVEDFLTKKVRENRGQRKQLYVYDSHDAIVPMETFELAQKELARRNGHHGRFHDSPFTNKMICGCCGAFYGHRIWHSNEPCRKEVWLCNDKYRQKPVCASPAVTEGQVIKAFLSVISRVRERGMPEDSCREVLLAEDERQKALDATLLRQTEDLNEAIGQIESLVAENARKAQNQEIYNKRFMRKLKEIDAMKVKAQNTRKQISEAMARKENIQIFLRGLRSIEGSAPVSTFDVWLWNAAVETLHIMPDRTMIFHLRNGNDETVSL